ncbi:macro domain-containing protein [Nonomuraea sp. LP-02]|uniref:macro domain-containing protein n=1 Tax=Nonomuraea sp. LP-02 TaxID=3097960 RepID=UPI002E3797E8|nr:macro domain-containing protein [Nonomuraea sp. LP-02]MED7927377.1 macro domain-containing protein [Nonomuraea sp. LP-02]
MTAAYRIGASLFRVGYGDLTKSTAEVLVSSDDNYLTMGGGVSRALYLKAGKELGLHARKLLPLSLGDVGVTTAGQLPAKYIFHAVTIDLDRNLMPDPACIKQLVTRSLGLAENLRGRSIALPALGTGTGQFPLYEGAQILVQTICDRLARGSSLEEVSLILLPGRGLQETDLAVFYQRAASLAAVGGQTRRLAGAVRTLERSSQGEALERLRPEIQDLLQEIRDVADVLRQRPRTLEDVDRLQKGTSAVDAGWRAVELADDVLVEPRWRDSQVERKALQTRLEGLSTLLNVHYGSLNKLEIEKARYGGAGVPIILENQITDVTAEIARVEDLMRVTRQKINQLGS